MVGRVKWQHLINHVLFSVTLCVIGRKLLGVIYAIDHFAQRNAKGNPRVCLRTIKKARKDTVSSRENQARREI